MFVSHLVDHHTFLLTTLMPSNSFCSTFSSY